MAAFCTKCGSALPSNTGFCPSCGTAVAAAASAAQASAVAPMPPASTSYQPVPPPGSGYPPPPSGYAQPASGYPPAAAYPAASAGSGGAGKTILIVCAVLFGLGLVVAGVVGFGMWRMSRMVHLNNTGKAVSLSMPGGGTISAGESTASDADLGVPVYPGATREKGGMQMNSATVSMTMAHFTTTDPVSQVTDFYKSKMPEGTTTVSSGNEDGMVLNSGQGDKDRVIVTVGKGNGDDEGKTTIVVMHTKKK